MNRANRAYDHVVVEPPIKVNNEYDSTGRYTPHKPKGGYSHDISVHPEGSEKCSRRWVYGGIAAAIVVVLVIVISYMVSRGGGGK